MAVGIQRPIEHTQTGFAQAQIMRAPAPYFAPPVPAYMREPGTNWFTTITANTQAPAQSKRAATSQAAAPAGAQAANSAGY